MDTNDRRRSVSVSSLSGYPMEVNTKVNIENQNGPTNVGATVTQSETEFSESNLQLNEQIQVNINGNAPVTIETPKKDPTINIINYGPTLTLSYDTIQKLKEEGEFQNFLKSIHNLSLKLKNSQEFLQEKSEIIQSRKNIRIDDNAVTICFDRPNYSLKGLNQPKATSVWAKIVPEKYVSVTRGVFSVCIICITVATIYGIVVVIMEHQK